MLIKRQQNDSAIGALERPQDLGVYVGKAAGRLWLYGDIYDFKSMKAAFLLALKYYWEREGRSSSNSDELSELTASGFTSIATWAGDKQQSRVEESNLGVAFFALSQWDDCISCFTSANAVEQDRPESWLYLGDAFKATGDYDGAITAYENAVRINPKSQRAWERLAEVHKVSGNIDATIRIYERARTKNMSAGWSWEGLGQAYIVKGELDEAIAVYEAASKSPRLSQAYRSLGDTYMAKGKYDKAIEAYQSAVEDKHGWQMLEWQSLANAH
jgi:tetratricopeptide (TPR) repeat protein